MGVVKLYNDLDDKEYTTLRIDGQKKLPIQIVKDFLFFFDISLEDISKLTDFSKTIEKNKSFVARNKKQFNSLTDRENEIFKLVVNGKSTAEIANILCVESTTISTHRKKIKQKLQLKSTFDWYRYARAFDLIEF
ncbi:helix-turn-helix transcriptional regulator [Polaribacter haliotis]|uniref:Helix-turn-helix transcriptional regulator n=1 Tax=Polaribacter haliotis TaxID=1888915 RepID=A0A7L8AHR0_9FLAO|nr:helix-turn-helix transcriptional regulator [Polaribacter haliotis]QOD61545.1 helix-turn-helix transcriptional regulator [Polaribacter haliotis]